MLYAHLGGQPALNAYARSSDRDRHPCGCLSLRERLELRDRRAAPPRPAPARTSPRSPSTLPERCADARARLPAARPAGTGAAPCRSAPSRSPRAGTGSRHALPVRLAVGGEREHRLEQRLELQRRPDLADEPDRLVAGVPELVRRSGLDDRDLAGPERQLLAADLQRRACPRRRRSARSATGGRAPRRRSRRAGRRVSITTASPSVSAEVARKVRRSPVTGFSMVSPVRIISCLLRLSGLTPRMLAPQGSKFVGCAGDFALGRAADLRGGAPPPRGGLRVARLDEAGFVREHDGLHAVAQARASSGRARRGS